MRAASSQVELWPTYFQVSIVSQRPLLREVMDWVKAHTPAMCVFMPDRLADASAHETNTTQFEALAAHLLQNQFVSLCIYLSSRRGGSTRLNSCTPRLRSLSPLGMLRTESRVRASSSSPRVLRGTYSSAPSSSIPIFPTSFTTSVLFLAHLPAPLREVPRTTPLFSVSHPHSVIPRVPEANPAIRLDGP